MAKIYVIHENDAWVEPLRAAFAELRLPFEEWFLSEGLLDLAAAPPAGVFYNRMSASSHTRGHRYAAEYTAGVLAWLESHRRRVVNDSRALQLEISKIAQYAALSRHGIRTPRTLRGGRPRQSDRRGAADVRSLHHQAQPRRQGTRGPSFPDRRGARKPCRQPGVRGFGRRHHADPGIHPGAGALHHAGRVRRRQASSTRCGSTPRSASSFAPPMSARLGTRSARWARTRRAAGGVRAAAAPRFRIIEDSVIRSSSAIGNSSPTTASASPASSSSPTAPARSTPTTSTPTPTTTATPRRGRHLRHARHRVVSGRRVAAAARRQRDRARWSPPEPAPR